MKKIILTVLALLLALSFFSTVCYAADPIEGYCFLNIDGIDGACRVTSYKNWLDLVDYKVNNTITDADGSEIPTRITFTCRVEPSIVRIYENYTNGSWIRDAKMDITEVSAGNRTVVSTLYMENVKITDFGFVVLDDGTVAETFTLTSLKHLTGTSQFGSTFGSGCIVLACVCAAVVIGGGVYFIVRKKKKKAAK